MKTDIICFLIIIACMYLSSTFELTPSVYENLFIGIVIGFLIIVIIFMLRGEI